MRIWNCLIAASLLVSYWSAGPAQAAPCDTLQIPTSAGKDAQNRAEGLSYSHSAKYHKEFALAVSDGKSFCQKYLKQHPDAHNLAIVSDIDETLLDNREEFAADPNHEWSKFEAWIREARAPALPTAQFVSWARQNGVAIFLITGRPERTRAATIQNLIKKHIAYDGLYLRGDTDKRPAGEYKSEVRSSIEAMGFTILVNIGDQWSDLSGGHALDCEKLPNEIYFIK